MSDDHYSARWDAAHRIESLLNDFADATYSILDRAAEAKAEAEGWPDGETYDAPDVYETKAATLLSLYPQIRELLAKANPEAWAFVLEGEAEQAEHDAEQEAKAKAAGFESHNAMKEAQAKARRSAAAKRGAETRKAMAEGGYAAVHALNKKREADRLDAMARHRGFENYAALEADNEAKALARAKAAGFDTVEAYEADQEAKWQTAAA